MADDYSDLLPGQPQRQSRTDLLYNTLVPDYLKYQEPSPMPPAGTPEGKIGPPSGNPTAFDIGAKALPDVLSWLSPGVGKAGAALGKSLGIMAGPLARTANLRNLNLAKEMWGQPGKFSPEQIHDATGWFKSGAGSPRFEISDAAMRAKSIPATAGMARAGAEHFIDHPELFEAYPQLKKTPVTVDPFYASEREGKYNYKPPPFRITVGGEANESGLTKPQLGTLLHELQHNVSYQEGTEMGTDPHWLGNDVLKRAGGLLTNPQQNPDRIRDVLIARRYARDPGVSFEMYRQNPAETEARNVAFRWRNDMRKVAPYPWLSEDIPRSSQFDYTGGMLARPYMGRE